MICLQVLLEFSKKDPLTPPSLHDLSLVGGALLGGNLWDGLSLFQPTPTENYARAYGVDEGLDIMKVPADLAILHQFCTVSTEGDKVHVHPWVLSDPYLGPVYRQRCCFSCGLIPKMYCDKAFAYCALCRDPAAGRFCCKEPCFAAAWAAGHKKECAGRDKLRKKGKT
jgi:hypothetical protein